VGGAGSLADYVAGWSGERNPGEDAVLCRQSDGRWCGERGEGRFSPLPGG